MWGTGFVSWSSTIKLAGLGMSRANGSCDTAYRSALRPLGSVRLSIAMETTKMEVTEGSEAPPPAVPAEADPATSSTSTAVPGAAAPAAATVDATASPVSAAVTPPMRRVSLLAAEPSSPTDGANEDDEMARTAVLDLSERGSSAPGGATPDGAVASTVALLDSELEALLDSELDVTRVKLKKALSRSSSRQHLYYKGASPSA